MRKLFCLLMSLSLGGAAFAQSDVVNFIRAGKDDASVLFKAYLEPYALAFGDGLNNGWYSSAGTHRLLGFDLSLSVSAVNIPSGSKTFDVTDLDLENTRLVSASGEAPTVAGSEEPGPEMAVYLDPDDPLGTEILRFHTPEGTGYDLIPVPMIQVGVGALPHTDLTVRYVPELSFNDDEIEVGLVGVGLKHNFKEWVPFLKLLPFDASVFLNYSKIDASTDLWFTSGDYDLDPGIPVEDTYVQDDNQQLKIKTHSWNYGLLISKKISLLTLFASIGHSSNKSDVDLRGSYPFVDEGDEEVIIYGETDPISLDFDSSNVTLNAGFRVKVSFFSLFASVNRAEYTSYNAGLGFGFR